MKATHTYCPYCAVTHGRAINPVTIEPPTNVSECGKYIGGDIQCAECKHILATVYKEVSNG